VPVAGKATLYTLSLLPCLVAAERKAIWATCNYARNLRDLVTLSNEFMLCPVMLASPA
jgi:hypothetical protein